MWRLKNDDSAPVITAAEHIRSTHGGSSLRLPETALVFFLGKGAEYIAARHGGRELPEPFPCFLKRRPVWVLDELGICCLNGGSGAPMAADTVETLAALGVRNIVAAGMFGAFSERVAPGEAILPEKAFVEEGTSLHYYDTILFARPDAALHQAAVSLLKKAAHPIVSTDAVYRQTFNKEQLWREMGAVGVDMETSAVFSVSRYLGIKAAALLVASDVHPLTPDGPKWAWQMTDELRFSLAEQALLLARAAAES